MTDFLGINVFDVVVLLYLFAWFVLGFFQGTVRRVVGTASIVFSFYLAAQLNDYWLGGFLAQNWTQFPREYSVMIGFLALFIAGVVAFTLIIQGTYRKAPLFTNYPVIDEILGGLVGIVQGFLVLLFLTFILDQYFLYTNLPKNPNELGFLRTAWDAINGSGTGNLLHSTVIPGLITLTGLLLPESVRAIYGR